jgi:hypothetical protein
VTALETEVQRLQRVHIRDVPQPAAPA